MHKMCWRLGTVDNAHNEGVTFVVVVLVKPLVSRILVRERWGTRERIRGEIEPKVDEHAKHDKEHEIKKPALAG